MITAIGITAGDIWQILDKSSPIMLRDIFRQTDAPQDLILMSLGWLAREGHVVLEKSDNEYVVTLVKRLASV